MSKVISVRIPDEMYDQIETQICDTNLTVSEWLLLRIISYEHLENKRIGLKNYVDELEQVFDQGFDINGKSIVEHLRSFL